MSRYSKQPETKGTQVKILLLGNSSVGKSSMLMQFSSNKFTNMYAATIGVDYRRLTLSIDGKQVIATIWDTAGQERFKAITNNYYRGTDGIMVIYDVSDQSSFEGVQHWMKDIEKCAEERVQKYLIGNKCDLEERRVIRKQQGEAQAKRFNVQFKETSAKLAINVNEAFEDLIRMIIKQKESKIVKQNVTHLEVLSKEKKGTCC